MDGAGPTLDAIRLPLQKKEIERKKKSRDLIKKELGPYTHYRGRGGRGGGPPGRYWNAGGDFAAIGDPNQMRRQEVLEKARLDKIMHMERVSCHETERGT